MLSKKAVKQFYQILNLGTKCRVSSILWNGSKRTRKDRILYFIVYYTGLIYYTCDMCYLNITVYNLIMDKTASIPVTIKVVTHWLSRFITLLFQYHGIWYSAELKAYCRHLFLLHPKLQRMPTVCQLRQLICEFSI